MAYLIRKAESEGKTVRQFTTSRSAGNCPGRNVGAEFAASFGTTLAIGLLSGGTIISTGYYDTMVRGTGYKVKDSKIKRDESSNNEEQSEGWRKRNK